MLRTARVAPLAPAVLAAVLCCVQPRADANSDDAVDDETIDAIWRIQRFDFTYNSDNIYYSCRALQTKVSAILRAVGAHHRVGVEVRCLSGEFVRYAYVRVTLATPTEATAEMVKAVTTYDTRTQLVARLRNLRLPTAEDIQRFPAAWQTVSLSRDRRLSLDSGDCDLLRGMRDQLFPKLSVRVATGGLRCTPGVASRMRPKFEVTALIPAPPRSHRTDRSPDPAPHIHIYVRK